MNDDESPLLDDLKRDMKVTSTDEAIQRAVEALRKHFDGKGSRLPFDYDSATGRFTAIDSDYLKFVKEMSSIRSINTKAHDFECSIAKRLGQRATGSIHRVGHPRDQKKKRDDFNAHLKTLGFGRPVLLGHDKDGGFDILWLLPVGTIPHRPLVSVQCKNGKFNMDVADQSVGAGSRSFSQHSGLQPSVHVPCVLFNDYICPDILSAKQLNFVPLGLTDLAPATEPISVQLI
ncbi:MAG: hypothetical protein LLG20_22485 [Acidobacteriales bacterium]|nr:hypothetical protein [Terriglobales bacterium]